MAVLIFRPRNRPQYGRRTTGAPCPLNRLLMQINADAVCFGQNAVSAAQWMTGPLGSLLRYWRTSLRYWRTSTTSQLPAGSMISPVNSPSKQRMVTAIAPCMDCTAATAHPGVRNNSRRGCCRVRRLQTRAESGMMNRCCNWRERSSE
jgi:hypothetical protein